MLVTTLGYLYGLSLGTYYGTVIRPLEVSTEVISERKFEVLLIDTWIGYLGGLDLGTNYGNALWFWYGKTLGTTLGYLDGLPPGTYYSTELGWSEGST